MYISVLHIHKREILNCFSEEEKEEDYLVFFFFLPLINNLIYVFVYVQNWNMKLVLEEDMREQDDQDRGRTERENKGRDILIERAIMGLSRNLTLEQFPRIHRDDPISTIAKTLSNSGKAFLILKLSFPILHTHPRSHFLPSSCNPHLLPPDPSSIIQRG